MISFGTKATLRLAVSLLVIITVAGAAVLPAVAQKNVWSGRLVATHSFLQQHMWNAATGNFVRRSDQPQALGSDAWGVTIMLDAYAYMVQEGFMKPDGLKNYYTSSTALYRRTGGNSGARILAEQGSQIYIGGDDDLQWCAALAHCYEATHDAEYLNAATSAFKALIEQGFWIEHSESGGRGWAWNSGDMRPNGVSTAYGALAAARLYQATGTYVYRWWALAALNALKTPQVGYFPRDMMVAAQAALTLNAVGADREFLEIATRQSIRALADASNILSGKLKGEINPTDIGDLAEGFARLYEVSRAPNFLAASKRFLGLFVGKRSDSDIAEHGFCSSYTASGAPVRDGSYLGVPLSVAFLPENAEMLKLFAVAVKYY